MKNKYCSRTLKLIALIVPLVVVFVVFQEYLFAYKDYNTVRIENFYKEEEHSLDVVFMGASEVFSDYSPTYAYEKFGYTSYMYAMDSNRGSLYLSQLKEILKTQSPKVLFVEVGGFLVADDDVLFDDARLRIYVESIPLSENKVRTIMEYPYEDKLSLFVPLFMHHGELETAWTHFKDAVKKVIYPRVPVSLKGETTVTNIYTGPGDVRVPDDPKTYGLTDNGKAFLMEFLDYCKSENLDNIVFVNFPRLIADEDNNTVMVLLKQVDEILNTYDYPLLNLQPEMERIGIDKNRDFYNEHHMNIYGQKKMTEYLGNLLLNEYGLTPRAQSARSKQQWEACVPNYKEFVEMADRAIQAGDDLLLSEANDIWIFRNMR